MRPPKEWNEFPIRKRPDHPLADKKGFVPVRLLGFSRSDAPYIQSDTLTPLRHPITGKLMDSKSQFRAVTRAHGCVEVGNEQQRDRRYIDMPNLKADIARSIQELGG